MTLNDQSNLVEKFDTQVGLSYLRGMHLNDSKTELNSKRDRHENIGMYVLFPLSSFQTSKSSLPRGHLGLRAFHHILTDPRVQHIPLVLETPSFELPETVWMTEIEVLNRLSGIELEGEGEEEGVLQEMIEHVRSTVQDAEKTSGKKGKKGTTKGAGKIGES